MKCSSCHANVRPIVAVDIDGTLAQYHAAFMEFLQRWEPTQFFGAWRWNGIGEFSDYLEMDKHVYQQAKLAFRAGGNKRWMKPFPGAVEFMQEVAVLNVEVWITTTRPWMRMDNIDPDTREWLRRYGIKYSHLIYDDDKYKLLSDLVDPNRIVMVLEDDVEQIHKAADLRLPVVVRRTDFNYDVNGPVGVPIVRDLWDALKILQERLAVYDALQH